MPLVPSVLAADLRSGWLTHEGGGYADSATQSADRFAQAVSNWFTGAMAGAFPCSTAMARKSQLAASAAAAVQAGQPALAALQLATGVAGYMAGQVFGPGVASPPAAIGAAQSALASVFADTDMSVGARAEQIASAVHTLALSTMVIFPPVISPPTPVT
jgi:hypothetical protein